MACESSAGRHRLIDEGLRRHLRGIASAQSLIFSADFGGIQPGIKIKRWDLVLKRLVEGSLTVQRGGADLLVKQDEGEAPLFDTTLLHARAAVRRALK